MAVDVSIIAPVYNEEKNLLELYSRLQKAVPKEFTWELILVDDGSRDKSADVIRKLCADDPRVRGVFFSRNYGHQIALTAGYDLAKGRVAITMDSDLQHPPESVADMIRLWKEGHDIVFAIREDSRHLPWLKKITSRWFYSFYKAVTKVDLIEGAADFRLLDGKVLHYLRLYRERDRFLRGIISDMGFRRTVMAYSEGVRQHGASKYNMWKMMRLAVTGVVSFSAFPLRLLMIFGFVISIVSIFYAFVIAVQKFVLNIPPGQASILVGIFFIGGVQLISIGVLGEYLMSVFKEVKARPLYCIRETVNCE